MKILLTTIIISIMLVNFVSNAQDITNTLAPNGKFKIKDGSADYLSLSQTTGNLTLFRNLELGGYPNSSATFGVITKGGIRFLHNYQAFGTDGYNTFMGLNAGNFTMSGPHSYDASYNTAVGNEALSSLTTGHYNSALGTYSLYNNSSGALNSAFGYQSLFSNTEGYSNCAFGTYSLSSNVDGFRNSGFGEQALFSNTSGYGNSAFGWEALSYNETGVVNSAFGYRSLFNLTLGDGNSAYGFGSLFNNSTGSYNTAIGYSAGSNIITGNNNIIIGYNAQVPSNESDNQVRIGNSSIGYAGIQVAWTVTSDRRWKENIQPTNLGLDFISKLTPVSYTRINDENHRTEYGLIAQELEEVLKKEGIENTGMLNVTDEGYYELRYNDLFAPMIKAIQELSIKNEKLSERLHSEKIEKDDQLSQLVEENKQLKSEIENLKSLKEEFSEIQKLKTELIRQINLLKAENKISETKFTSVEKELK